MFLEAFKKKLWIAYKEYKECLYELITSTIITSHINFVGRKKEDWLGQGLELFQCLPSREHWNNSALE